MPVSPHCDQHEGRQVEYIVSLQAVGHFAYIQHWNQRMYLSVFRLYSYTKLDDR